MASKSLENIVREFELKVSPSDRQFLTADVRTILRCLLNNYDILNKSFHDSRSALLIPNWTSWHGGLIRMN